MDDAVAAFVIGPRTFTAVRLSAGRREIERRAREFADRRADDAALAAALAELRASQAALEQLEERLP